ncbi:MAG: hypothetical protein EOP21_00395 [Hyphomicrobiales bacterium]|nr:MAG: hypothetical protein EOP21_00395 [Hyphomicrobiales bacterium]
MSKKQRHEDAVSKLPPAGLYRPIYRLDDGWLFQTLQDHGPSDGWVFHPCKPEKGCHPALGLGGVVICDKWKRSRRLLGLA